MKNGSETTDLAELEADNKRLRRLLDQRDAPAELRHRLHSTLAMMRIIIRKSAETKRDLDEYVAHLEDRVDAVARAQLAADREGVVDLHNLFANELHHYGAREGEQVSLAGPEIHLMPRAGQVLALAVHELAVNAVEHGALGAGAGQVAVSWALAGDGPAPVLTITWKEFGSSPVTDGHPKGFGTEVLTDTLAYELKASTTLAFDPEGLTCVISFPLGERIGEPG